ncbi:MAG: hypothetical protein WAM66_02390 [Acidobacteriaceae bacterium]
MDSVANAETMREPSMWQRAAPALTLAVLAPVIAEVLNGSTRLSFLFVLVPEIMVWGCGALMIREAVRRWKGGGTSMVLLGLALAVAEEWVIQQTSLAPYAWPGASANYGRLWGVNWIWFVIMLGYECVWVTLVPVQVTELIFHKRRTDRWLSNRGFVVTGAVFVAGSFLAWFLWTHIARPKTYHVPMYQPPAWQLIVGVLMIVALALAAYALRGREHSDETDRWMPPAWAVGVAALLLPVPWFWLMSFIFGGKTGLPFWVPVAIGVVWAAVAWWIVQSWTTARGWHDMRRWALVFGATVSSMALTFLGSGTWPRMDLIFKIVVNALAVVGFLLLAQRLMRTAHAGEVGTP